MTSWKILEFGRSRCEYMQKALQEVLAKVRKFWENLANPSMTQFSDQPKPGNVRVGLKTWSQGDVVACFPSKMHFVSRV